MRRENQREGERRDWSIPLITQLAQADDMNATWHEDRPAQPGAIPLHINTTRIQWSFMSMCTSPFHLSVFYTNMHVHHTNESFWTTELLEAIKWIQSTLFLPKDKTTVTFTFRGHHQPHFSIWSIRGFSQTKITRPHISRRTNTKRMIKVWVKL